MTMTATAPFAEAATLTNPTIVRFDDYPGDLTSPVGIGELQGNEYQQYGVVLDNWYQYRDPNDQADGVGISLGREPVNGLERSIGVIQFTQPVRNLSFQWWTIWDEATLPPVDDPALKMSVIALDPNGVKVDLLRNLSNHQIINNNFVYSISTAQVQGQAIGSLWVSGYVGYSQITTLQYEVASEPIPTPALFPGLMSMAIATWRRRRKSR
ncbi:MAG: PTPA-CTERM sorting domain-containing protein [Synechococcales bacterium]|nr:PTPA-CTERM sorting domain-containing protein [Synechococcales bacterium]